MHARLALLSPPTRWQAALLASALAALPGLASAQQSMVLQPPPQNVVNLSAEASREVPQDLMAITLVLTREGADAAAVQSQLRQALDAALAEARKALRPGLLDLRTGAFGVSPRYAAKPGAPATIAGWLGRAELLIEGSDLAAISQLAGRLPGLTVSRVGFGLSREAREKVEADVAAQAIGRFKGRAEAYAKQFGFGSYSLREVSVGGGEAAAPVQPMFRVQAMAAAAPGGEAQPVEAGKTVVSVTVSGSIQLSPR
jgi:predicted secreted protein